MPSIQRTPRHLPALDRILTEPAAQVATEGPSALPVVKRVSFRQPTPAVDRDAARRDARIDAAAKKLAAALGKLGYGVRLSGAHAGPDMLRGVLARAYKGDGRTFGEVYCKIDLDVPGVKERQHMALMRTRDDNAPTYVDDTAKLMLGFVDKKSGKLWGSGYGLDTSLFDAAPADVKAKTDALVADMVAKLESFRALNAKKTRPAAKPKTKTTRDV